MPAHPPPLPVLHAVALWALILACAVANGALREAVLVPALGAPWALLASGALLGACIVGVALWGVPRLGPLAPRQALAIGALWLALTLAFEFGFGRLVRHRPWAELLEAYTFRDGNLWPLLLVLVLLAPWLALRWRAGP